MKYHVNENCIGCGLCAGMCPEIFRMNDVGVAEALDLETDLDTAEEAMDSCPMAAIEQE